MFHRHSFLFFVTATFAWLSFTGIADLSATSSIANMPIISDAILSVEDSELIDKQVPNGIYLIQRWTVSKSELMPLFDREILLKHDPRVLDPDSTDEIRHITVYKSVGVAFENLERYTPVDLSDGRIRLDVTFSDQSAKELENLTRKFLGRQVGIVIGGQVVTVHKIRSVIKNGNLTISRCDDDGCQVILKQLQSNRKPENK